MFTNSFQNVLLPIPTSTTTDITVVKQRRRRMTILKIKVASVTAVCFRKTVCVARETSTYLVPVESVRATFKQVIFSTKACFLALF